MSYTRVSIDNDLVQPRTAWAPQLGRMARLAVWSVLNAVLLFGEQLAELLAPLCFIAGGIWWAIPRGLAALTLDGAANDILQVVRARFPHEITVDGSDYSAATLITYGIYLVAVVAICRTLSTAITSLLLDRR